VGVLSEGLDASLSELGLDPDPESTKSGSEILDLHRSNHAVHQCA
jgi:hypothetical protein